MIAIRLLCLALLTDQSCSDVIAGQRTIAEHFRISVIRYRVVNDLIPGNDRHFEVSAKPSHFLVVKKERFEPGTVGGIIIHGENPQYTFDLTRTESGKVQFVYAGPARPKWRERLAADDLFPTVAFRTVFGCPLDQWLADRRTRFTVNRNNDVVEIKYSHILGIPDTTGMAPPDCTGVLTFDAKRGFRMVKHNYTVNHWRAGKVIGTTPVFQTVVYASDHPLAVPLRIEIAGIETTFAKEKEYFVYDDISLPSSIPDEAFRISAFGLEEPFGVTWPKPTPWFLYFSAGGFGLFFLALFLWRVLAKRQARAGS